MSNLVVLGFADEDAADRFIKRLDAMQDEEILDLEDFTKVTVDEKGKSHLHHGASLVRGGALVGGMVGAVLGMLVLAPVAGAALGAAGGAAIGGVSGDYGIDDDFIKQTAEMLKPGTAAVFLLVKHATPDKVEAELADTQATVISTTLSAESEARLRDALS